MQLIPDHSHHSLVDTQVGEEVPWMKEKYTHVNPFPPIRIKQPNQAETMYYSITPSIKPPV